MTSYTKPTSQQLDEIELLALPQERYFFERLENPEWIEPLAARDFFKHPPAPVTTDAGTRFPPWPASRYLVRMATIAPDVVARIFAGIETSNSHVIGDLIDAAKLMPTAVAASLVPKICAAHKAGVLWAWFHNAAQLSARLASQGPPDAALSLTQCLFAIEPDRDGRQSARNNSHWYIDGLREVIPALIAQRAEAFLVVMLKWLQNIADAKSRGAAYPDYDGSLFWRPAIEEHEQNLEHDFASRYLGCVREAFEIALRDHRVTLDKALSLLRPHSRLIFTRLGVHLTAAFADQDHAIARRTIMDRALFDNAKLQREYAILCRERFGLLEPTMKLNWFKWLSDGPDAATLDRSLTDTVGQSPSEDDRSSFIRRWQFARLQWVHDSLDDDWNQKYQAMLSEYGPPDSDGFHIRTLGARWGHESPFSIEDFKGKELHQIMAIMSSWRPDPTSFGPSIEGAAETLKQILMQSPDVFVSHAPLFKDQPAIYVRTYLGVMKDAIHTNPSPEWIPVIDLCKWVIQQPLPSNTRATRDGDWQWTRDCVSEFVTTACEQGIALEYRQSIWDLILPLTSDSADSYVIEQEDIDPRVKDYAIDALNTPCSKAMHAAFEYARWIAKLGATTVDGREVVEGGFEQMPEVRALLDQRLSPGDPGGFAMRATFGWHFSLLYWIDKDWLVRNANRIFDLEVVGKHPPAAYGWAAWNMFLKTTQPHIEYYRLLKSQFGYVVDQASTIPETPGLGPAEG